MSVKKHTLETAEISLKTKGLLDYIRILSIDEQEQTILVEDKEYGQYKVDIKALSPKTSFPLHKQRKHQNKLVYIKSKYIGTKINNLEIINVFYGPDNGYKNRSFYFEYRGSCGHTLIDTYSVILRHKKSFACRECNRINLKHGERIRVDGKLQKRSSTYNFWQRKKSQLPEKFQEFTVFKQEVGEKPKGKSELIQVDGKFSWLEKTITEDREIHLMATALRQAFRHSSIYNNALMKARVETEDGPRYKCAICKGLFKRTYVQIDHITAIKDINGAPLTKDNLIERIWTTNVQVLDKKCHVKKSTIENITRRKLKNAS